MSFIRLAQVAALAVLLIVGAGSVSVESADCNDQSFICASGSPWYRASEVKIRLSSAAGADYTEWKFVLPDANSVSIDFDSKAQGRSQSGQILLMNGRVMLTKGFSPPKGHEIDALDLPMLNYQLVVTLLSQAFPPGPDKFEGNRTIDLAERKRSIKIATTSASGRYPSPWTLKGEMQRSNVETIAFSFMFSFEAGGTRHRILINGEWKKGAVSPRLDPSMSLKGWSLYALGGVSIKQKGATILDYAAQPQGTTLRTLGELQESIRRQPTSGSIPAQTKHTKPEKIAGQINWIAREAATGKIIDRGTMTIHVRDISVKRKSSEDEAPFFAKRIDLNRDFYFEMAEFPETDLADLEGFGLVIEHRNLRTFCWEWFNVDRGKHALKLQETGELFFDAKKVGSRWEITRTDFLTDVTFRIKLYETAVHEDDPKWRITILKGSYVIWPSLVGDTVIPNS